MTNVITEDIGGELEQYILGKLGYEEWLGFCRKFGGRKLYIPKGPTIEARDREIRKLFGRIVECGRNVNANAVLHYLGQRFGLSDRQVRRIVS